MDNEDAFAREARDEALLSRMRTSDSDDTNKIRYRAREAEIQSETSPLLSDPTLPGRPHLQSSESYQKAIDEPWHGAHGSAGLPWHKKPSIFWLLPAFLPFAVAFGGLIVPKTYLILNLICKDYLSDRAAHDPTFHFMPVIFGSENPQCRDPHVQTLVAHFNLYASLLGGIFAALVSPHLGALSDRVGRRRVIAFASLGSFMMEIITIVVGTHPEDISVYWILLGNLFDGLCGSFTTSMAISFAYASDCSAPERRAVTMGYFHGALFFGVGIGPILAGWLINLTGNIMIVFYIALGCHAFFILFVLFVVPESLSEPRQKIAREKWTSWLKGNRDKSWTTIVRGYHPLAPLQILAPRGPGSSPQLRRNMILLAAIDTLMFGVAMGTMQIIIIYAQFKFGFSVLDSSMFMTAANVCRVFALVVVLPFLTRMFRGRQLNNLNLGKGSDKLDVSIIRVVILFDMLGYIGYAFVPTGPLLVLSGMIAAFGGIGPPTLQSSLTKSVPPDRTGQILGASGLLHALARFVAPTVFNLIYGATADKFVGTVFVCLASCFVIAFVMSWFLKPHVYWNEPSASEATPPAGEEST